MFRQVLSLSVIFQLIAYPLAFSGSSDRGSDSKSPFQLTSLSREELAKKIEEYRPRSPEEEASLAERIEKSTQEGLESAEKNDGWAFFDDEGEKVGAIGFLEVLRGWINDEEKEEVHYSIRTARDDVLESAVQLSVTFDKERGWSVNEEGSDTVSIDFEFSLPGHLGVKASRNLILTIDEEKAADNALLLEGIYQSMMGEIVTKLKIFSPLSEKEKNTEEVGVLETAFRWVSEFFVPSAKAGTDWDLVSHRLQIVCYSLVGYAALSAFLIGGLASSKGKEELYLRNTLKTRFFYVFAAVIVGLIGKGGP